MGYYIQTGSNFGKVQIIARDHGAFQVSQQTAKAALADGKGVVCVVNNGIFEAAAFIYDDGEFQAFADPSDTRPKTWLVMDLNRAKELSGYNR